MRHRFRHASRLILAAAAAAAPLACRPPAAATPRLAPAAPAARPGQRAAEFRLESARLAAAGAGDLRLYHVESYDLKARFDWPTQTLFGRVVITLALAPSAPADLVLDSQVDAVEAVEAFGRPLPFTADRAQGRLTIDLSGLPPSAAASSLALAITYRTAANANGLGIPSFQPDALRAVGARAGDPVSSRTVNTYSEPTGARQWMPCHDDPADRARFAIELTMPPDEALIANGALEKDTVDPTTLQRTMRYATRYSLPTYLMAFAEGEFVAATTMHGSLPVSVWARRGVPVDLSGILDQTTRQLSLYEALLFPYPFEKYAVVLLPEFSGGEEHASVTFINETEDGNPQLAGHRSMNGHEMAHQWFGDYMTIAAWDDLWVKEGMATLMESEQSRPYADENGSGRLFGSQFQVAPGEAIVDRGLDPEAKYTSGPYGRAAWLLTQVRSVVGEEAFWRTLRETLTAHAYGTITGEEFLAAFRPALGEAVWQRALAALPAKALPQLTVAPAPAGPGAGAGPGVTLALTDPEGALITPLDVRAYRDVTTYASQPLAAGGRVTIPDDAARLWVLDPQDRHPVASFFPDQGGFTAQLLPLLAPRSAAARAAFYAQPASVQGLPMYATQPAFADAPAFLAAYARMGSEDAKALALQMACASARSPRLAPAALAAWQAAVTQVLVDPPYLGVTSWYVTPWLGGCAAVVGPLFATQLAQLEANPASPGASVQQLMLLAGVGVPAADALAAFGAVAASGPSVQVRLIAVRALLAYLDGKQGLPRPDADGLPAWQRFFRELLAQTQVQELESPAISAVVATGDLAALPALGRLVATADAPIQDRATCAAYTLTKAAPQSWAAFVASLGDPATLPEHVRTKLTHPETCG